MYKVIVKRIEGVLKTRLDQCQIFEIVRFLDKNKAYAKSIFMAEDPVIEIDRIFESKCIDTRIYNEIKKNRGNGTRYCLEDYLNSGYCIRQSLFFVMNHKYKAKEDRYCFFGIEYDFSVLRFKEEYPSKFLNKKLKLKINI